MLLPIVKIFEKLSEEDREQLYSMMTPKAFKRNAMIISQGDTSRSLFIILKGRLKVFSNDEEGNQTIFAFLSAGDYCGELSLLDARPRSATIVTLAATDVLQLSFQQFEAFLDEHPSACHSLMSALTARIRELDDTISSLISHDVYGRLVHVLHKEAHEEGDKIITQRITHQELAEMIGASREMVTRILNDLRKEGYIDIVNKQISIERKIPHSID